MKVTFAACFLVVFVLAISVFSQGQPGSGVTPEMRTAANGLYQASDWTGAVAAYEKIVALEPANPNANYRLGMSLLNLNRSSEAQKHFDKAFTTSPNPVYGLALRVASGAVQLQHVGTSFREARSHVPGR